MNPFSQFFPEVQLSCTEKQTWSSQLNSHFVFCFLQGCRYMSAEVEESKCQSLFIIWLFLRPSILIIHTFLEGECWHTAPESETKGIVVNGERKSPLAANSTKALTISNRITNFNGHFRKIEQNMEYIYIARNFVYLFDQ